MSLFKNRKYICAFSVSSLIGVLDLFSNLVGNFNDIPVTLSTLFTLSVAFLHVSFKDRAPVPIPQCL